MEENIVIAAFFILLAMVISLVISSFLTKRAIFKVVGILCKHDALGVKNSKTLNQLGLNPPNLIKRIIHLRDYKPYALQILRREGIVRMTEEGKLYLVEAKLNEKLKYKNNPFPKIEP